MADEVTDMPQEDPAEAAVMSYPKRNLWLYRLVALLSVFFLFGLVAIGTMYVNGRPYQFKFDLKDINDPQDFVALIQFSSRLESVSNWNPVAADPVRARALSEIIGLSDLRIRGGVAIIKTISSLDWFRSEPCGKRQFKHSAEESGRCCIFWDDGKLSAMD